MGGTGVGIYHSFLLSSRHSRDTRKRRVRLAQREGHREELLYLAATWKSFYLLPSVAALSEALARLEGVEGIKEGVPRPSW